MKSWFFSLVSFTKNNLVIHLFEFVFLFLTILSLPSLGYVVSSNKTPSISKKVFDVSASIGQSPIGRVDLISDIYYYRYDDFPYSGVLRLKSDQPDVNFYKFYPNINLNYLSNESFNTTFVCTTTVQNDSITNTNFYPVDSDGTNKWSIVSDWGYFPSGFEIGIPSFFADQLLESLDFSRGDYSSLLGRNVTFSSGYLTLDFSIACVFNENDPSFGRLKEYFGSFFLTRLEMPINIQSCLYFEAPQSESALDDFLSDIDKRFSDETTIKKHRLSFKYLIDGEFCDVPNLAKFLEDMYSFSSPVNWVPTLIYVSLFSLSSISLFIIFFWIDLSKTNLDCRRNLTFYVFLIGVLSVFMSLIIWALVDTMTFIGTYSVPIYTITNMLISIFGFLFVYLCVYCVYKIRFKYL